MGSVERSDSRGRSDGREETAEHFNILIETILIGKQKSSVIKKRNLNCPIESNHPRLCHDKSILTKSVHINSFRHKKKVFLFIFIARAGSNVAYRPVIIVFYNSNFGFMFEDDFREGIVCATSS